MANEYRVLETVLLGSDGTRRYVSVREWRSPGDESFSFCPHHHRFAEKAAKCRNFGANA
jgi:hypothetical protein